MNPCIPEMWAKQGLEILLRDCPLTQAVDRAILRRVHAFLRNRPAITQTLTYSIDRASSLFGDQYTSINARSGDSLNLASGGIDPDQFFFGSLSTKA